MKFARETSVVPLEGPDGLRVDMVLARLELEREATRRAVPVPVAGAPVSFITAEDLMLQKIVSDRPRDHEDAEGIVRRQRDQLDRTYLLPRVAELGRSLDKPDLAGTIERWLRA